MNELILSKLDVQAATVNDLGFKAKLVTWNAALTLTPAQSGACYSWNFNSSCMRCWANV